MDITLERILKLKKDKGITDAQFQKDIGVYATALSEWKNGKTTSYLKKLPKIAAYFDVSVDYLLGNTDTPKKPIGAQADELNKLLKNEKIRNIVMRLEDAPEDTVEMVAKFIEAVRPKDG